MVKRKKKKKGLFKKLFKKNNSKKATPKRKKNKKKTILKKIMHFSFIAFIWAMIFAFFFIIYITFTLPDINQIKTRANLRPQVTFLDVNNHKIATYGDSYKYASIEKIPKHLQDAVLSIEDRRFYSHSGFDPKGFTRAMLVNLKEMRLAQGGSTITQQLAKNLFLTNEKSVVRKIQEVMLSFYIETKFTKEEILESYLNNVYFGSGNYGVESASLNFFGKPIDKINFQEAVILAGLLKAPTTYSPRYHREKSIQRAKIVAQAMKNNNITIPDINFNKLIVLNDKPNAITNNTYYFTDMASDLVHSYIGEPKEDMTIKTTFDIRIQEQAEKSISLYKEDIKNRNAEQIGFISMKQDGAIVAMMGGFNYKKSQFNRSTQAKRQTGSAFKPIVYLTAFEKGLKPNSIIEDSPINIKDWSPKNFDLKYRGDVTVEEAFIHSYNIPAIKIMKKMGVKSVIDMSRRLGITAHLENNLTTALGSNSISLLELTNAYNIIANGGYNVTPYAILSIETDKGKELYKNEPTKTKIIKSKPLRYINKLLKEAVENGTGKNAKIDGIKCYGKTGTTQDYRDAWFIGYTNKLTTGVWIGNDDNTPTDHITGGSFPAKIWKAYNIEANKIQINKNKGNNYFWGIFKNITNENNFKPASSSNFN